MQQSCISGIVRFGAAGPTRTDDLTLTKRLLYQLSYSGMSFPEEREF
jgi:hypothetical protein